MNTNKPTQNRSLFDRIAQFANSLPICMVAVWGFASVGPRVPSVHAQAIAAYPSSKLTVIVRSQCDCPSNLILLSDVVELRGSEAMVRELREVVVGISPKVGNSQLCSRELIERVLMQRGVAREAMVWSGAKECSIVRVNGSRQNKPNLDSGSQFSDPFQVQNASAQSSFPGAISTPPSQAGKQIDDARFVPTNVTPVTIRTAERNVSELISRYLQTMTDSNAQWIVKPIVPPENAKTLSIAQQIKSLACGQPPWEGDQEFMLLVKGANGEQTIPIRAHVKLPDMVVAANRPLSKGYILKETDLVWIPMPRGLAYGAEECFATPDSIVGQQLKRSMSVQQVIRHTEVGPPTVVQTGDMISVEVVSGPVVVSTNGRAIEAGSIDDLIQVEIEPNRSRVVARVTGPKTAEVLATSGRIQTPKNASTTASRNQYRR